MNERFAIGDDWTRRGRAVDARAATRGDVIADTPDGATRYPRYVATAKGAYVWDVDGNRYVDYLLGYGPVVLGHADPEVTNAVVDQLAQGHCIAPLWSPRQVELAELLAEVIPGAEQALFLKTGSDATSAAVRLARIHTGRELIVRWGYNGWHDWSVEQAPGVPKAVRDNTIVFDFDDLDGLREIVTTRRDKIAAVLTMPFELDVVSAAHLTAIRHIAHEAGALLIYDEIRSGFRMDIGGAQKHFEVYADLVTFSKAMANGYTISALTGPVDVMKALANTKISSTFYANPADMAAAIATIRKLRDTDAISRLWSLGKRLQDGIATIAGDAGLPMRVMGYPPMPFAQFAFDDAATNDAVTAAFFADITARGVLMHPHHQWFLSAAHTEDDIDVTLDACAESMKVAAMVANPVDRSHTCTRSAQR